MRVLSFGVIDSGKMSAHAPQICDSSVNRLRILHFNRQIHTCYRNIFFLLNKICDGGSWKEPFLKAATLTILIWAYPRKRKQTMGILKMPLFCRVRLLTGDEHAHSFCRCVGVIRQPYSFVMTLVKRFFFFTWF